LKCISALIATLLCLTMLGCKAKPGKPAGFVDHAVMANDKTLPFHLAWKKEGLDFGRYQKIYVAPVDISHLLETTDWQKGDRKEQYVADVGTIARFTKAAVEKSFKDDPAKHFTVLEEPTQETDTLIFNISLIEVVPSKVVLNALGYTPFFIGTGIKAVRALANDQSTVAFEARMIDAASGETVMMLADREAEQSSVVSVRGLTWYSHLQAIVSHWAAQFVHTTNQKPGETIKDSDAFTLQPW
jgi:Protein of unknown function (DUF3313)